MNATLFLKATMVAVVFFLASVFAVAESLDQDARFEPANLVIYRTIDNSAVNYRMAVDGEHIGKLKPNSAIKLQLGTGDHVISFNDRNKTQLRVVIGGDAVTYIRKEIDRRNRILLTVGTSTAGVADKLTVKAFVAQL